jgi:hypothetical protein
MIAPEGWRHFIVDPLTWRCCLARGPISLQAGIGTIQPNDLVWCHTG